MIGFAEKLTLQPSEVRQEDVDRLRGVGFSDEDIVDIVYVTAFFNMIDRVADGLGVAPDPYFLAKLPQ